MRQYRSWKAEIKMQTGMREWKHVLTEHIEGESEARQAETLKEAQGAEHGDVYREGNTQTKHQHEKHRENQHWVSTKPSEQREAERERRREVFKNVTD